jgi:methylmalonyl-CoA mutase N-terminal domain/subunit
MPVEKKVGEPEFRTMSGLGLNQTYRPEDLAGWSYAEKLADPGQYPFTRGPHETMYRGRRWTMRMFAGFGSPSDTNRRFKYLLEQGQTGLSTAFDMPTLMGYDPDHQMSLGEVGREGVSVATLDDMRRLFDGIPLDKVSTSMTINAPAIVLLAFYIALADETGVDRAQLRGTTQNDMLKEFIAQKEWICPIRPAMRIIRDMIAFCTDQLPKWNTISISGYHIREAGATAIEELAFTLADGLGYVQLAKDAGLDVDAFAPRLSFFFDVHNDFFEEVAKLRAARRIWARALKERFGAQNRRSLLLRTHCQTAGVSLTAQQPHNNIVRTTLQALAAVLGGTQSLHTNSYDETYALPTEEAVTVALRTQQIISDESGVPNVVDPLAGSYFVEKLTDEMEAAALDIIHKIDEMGGIVEAIEAGYPQQQIAKSAYRFQRQVEKQEQIIVGINRYVVDEDVPIETLKIDPEVEKAQIARIKKFRSERDAPACTQSLAKLTNVAETDENIFPPIIEAVKAGATIGEISDVFRNVFGIARDPAYW